MAGCSGIGFDVDSGADLAAGIGSGVGFGVGSVMGSGAGSGVGSAAVRLWRFGNLPYYSHWCLGG